MCLTSRISNKVEHRDAPGLPHGMQRTYINSFGLSRLYGKCGVFTYSLIASERKKYSRVAHTNSCYFSFEVSGRLARVVCRGRPGSISAGLGRRRRSRFASPPMRVAIPGACSATQDQPTQLLGAAARANRDIHMRTVGVRFRRC